MTDAQDEPLRHLDRIYRIVAALSHRTTPDEVAEALVNEVAETLGARAVSAFLFDDERQRIVVARATGYPPDILERWSQTPVDRSSLLSTVRDGQPVFARSRLEEPRFDPALVEKFGEGGGFLLPLESGGRVLGCLAASFDHAVDFNAAERRFLVTLAGHCAMSLERARLFEAAEASRAAADAARRELEAVLHQLPVAVSVVGIDGSVRVNAQTQAIYGTSFRQGSPPQAHPSAAVRRPDGSLYSQDELPIVRALRGQTIVGEEVLIERSDNQQRRRVRVNAAPIRNDAHQIVSAVAIFSDITDEHRVAEELRASERRYRAVLRATNDVIWEFSPQSGRLEWNGALERVFGYSPEETNQHPEGGFAWWLDHVHPDDRQPAADAYRAAATGGAATWLGEYRFRRADGAYIPTLDRCVFERDDAGTLLRVVGAISDVSEQHRLLQELRDAVRVRDEFLSIAGHELRTPLAALSAQLLGLQQLPLDAPRRAQKLTAAERQVRRLTTLCGELLDISRIVHGRLRLERESADLAEIVREAAGRLADEFQRDGVSLEIVATEPVTGHWDRLRVDLVVTNLLTNALRYGERRPVRVSVESDGSNARVTVQDQGLGIRQEDQERIFERFVRAVPARQFGGLGVGLWLARQIVDAHGGRLTVTSAPGQGSTFTAVLPR